MISHDLIIMIFSHDFQISIDIKLNCNNHTFTEYGRESTKKKVHEKTTDYKHNYMSKQKLTNFFYYE